MDIDKCGREIRKASGYVIIQKKKKEKKREKTAQSSYDIARCLSLRYNLNMDGSLKTSRLKEMET